MDFSVPAVVQPNLLPTHAIDTFAMRAEQSREIRQQIVDGTFWLEGPVAPDLGDRVRTRVWFLGDTLIARSEAEPNAIFRSEALIMRNPAPVLKVRVYDSGHSRFVQGDRQRTIGPGAIHFIDHDRPHRQISSRNEHTTLAIPYHAVGYDPSVHPAILSIGLDTPHGRLLEVGLGSVLGEISTVTAAEAAVLESAVAGLVRGILAGAVDSDDEDSVRRARIAAMKRYIDQNLADPELGIDALLRNFGASRATIYRNFADVGGLQRYIIDRRLHRAYRALAEAAPVRGAVQAAAERAGFVSLAHFSRSFSARFGERPSDIVGHWLPVPQSAPAAEPSVPIGAMNSLAEVEALHWSYRRFR